MSWGELTDEQINTIIGDGLVSEDHELKGDWFNFCNSRDDISRAEAALPEGLRHRYIGELVQDRPKCITRCWFLITASPRQRAEALVRTLGGGE